MVHFGMTTNIKIAVLLLGFALCLPSCGGGGDEPKPTTKVPAFPGAEGGGMYTTGGRGGEVIHVTTLSDERDPGTGQPVIGSLRKALQMDGARTVVFDVSGTINLKSQLEITGGNLTVAGQTAPGDGICIAGYPIVVKTSNVIIRFVRFRMGDQNKVEGDALTICEHQNIIVDHCSFSWSTDECVSCYGNTDFTLQYCFITESLRRSVHVKGNHGYGGIWGGKNATFHHNLLAHHDSRNPRFDHSYVNNKCFGPVDYVNNVVYNWGGNSTYGGEGYDQARKINMVNNYYKYGPATSKKNRLVDPTVSCSYCSDGHTLIPGKFWLEGNYMYGDANVTADNWKGSTQNGSNVKASARWTDDLTSMMNEQSAEAAYESVLSKAGCSLHRDEVDARIVNEVRSGTYTYTGSNGSKNGLIDAPDDVGGYPKIAEIHRPDNFDTDRDGMPDVWEDEHGLDKTRSADGKEYDLDKKYTNLEVYLNSLVQDLF